MNNQAFIDGQNLYTNIKANNWAIDLRKFRIYLAEKYHVTKAYYFLGSFNGKTLALYRVIQDAGFILIFRKHSQAMLGKKKGNVDTDVVFTIMAKIADRENFDKVILVSGDGDYFRMVEYLINKNRFLILLSPNHHSTSSLYKIFISKYVDFLDQKEIKTKISYSKPKS